MKSLANKKILVGVTGSIAAYKAAELIRQLMQQGASVKVVMTQNAQQFISPITLQALSQHPVYVDQFGQDALNAMAHIELARWADCILIAPASANFIATIANGFAQDLLSSLCLAATVSILIAPAMNQGMWLNIRTQENIKKLGMQQIQVLPVGVGLQACGEEGPGCLLEIKSIIDHLQLCLAPKILSNVPVLITAGPTHEPIDPIRYISNYSSGKMGYALAKTFAEAGHPVTLISGPCALTPPSVSQFIAIKTAEEMYNAVMMHIASCAIFISVAAVADYRIKNPHAVKLKKTENSLQLELIKNPDILAEVALLSPKPFIVGFAAETDNALENAKEKLNKKNINLLVLNQIANHAPFNSDSNEVWVLEKENAPIHLPNMLKNHLAEKLRHLIMQKVP